MGFMERKETWFSKKDKAVFPKKKLHISVEGLAKKKMERIRCVWGCMKNSHCRTLNLGYGYQVPPPSFLFQLGDCVYKLESSG